MYNFEPNEGYLNSMIAGYASIPARSRTFNLLLTEGNQCTFVYIFRHMKRKARQNVCSVLIQNCKELHIFKYYMMRWIQIFRNVQPGWCFTKSCENHKIVKQGSRWISPATYKATLMTSERTLPLPPPPPPPEQICNLCMVWKNFNTYLGYLFNYWRYKKTMLCKLIKANV